MCNVRNMLYLEEEAYWLADDGKAYTRLCTCFHTDSNEPIYLSFIMRVFAVERLKSGAQARVNMGNIKNARSLKVEKCYNIDTGKDYLPVLDVALLYTPRSIAKVVARLSGKHFSKIRVMSAIEGYRASMMLGDLKVYFYGDEYKHSEKMAERKRQIYEEIKQYDAYVMDVSSAPFNGYTLLYTTWTPTTKLNTATTYKVDVRKEDWRSTMRRFTTDAAMCGYRQLKSKRRINARMAEAATAV